MAAIFLSLMVGAVPLAAAAPPDRDRSGVELVDLPEDVPQEAAEENRLTELTTGNIDPEDEFDPQAVAEPAGGQVVEELSDIAPGELVPLGDLPIAVGAPEDASAEATEALEGEWQAALASPEEVAATEIQGLVFSVNPPAEASGEVVVSLDYTEFAELYGAAWADRLDLTRLPSCFLETPEVEACTEPADVSTDQSVTPKAGDAPTDGKLDGTRRITATLDVAELTGRRHSHTQPGRLPHVRRHHRRALPPAHRRRHGLDLAASGGGHEHPGRDRADGHLQGQRLAG
ncbi:MULTISPECIES: hypothetical protein [Streptomyces]|uniref:hypothetical protein n=1 Tax=Streptomyces TaxID=1883 RepID=UPI001FFF281B|nr:hypothetical protein [Streptomyces sp. WAC00276]MCK2141459.1 hypothetical protein [Streptomyces sp. WAC00276]